MTLPSGCTALWNVGSRYLERVILQLSTQNRNRKREIESQPSTKRDEFEIQLRKSLERISKHSDVRVSLIPYRLNGSATITGSDITDEAQSPMLFAWLSEGFSSWIWATHWAVKISDTEIFELGSNSPYWPPFRRRAKLVIRQSGNMENLHEIFIGRLNIQDDEKCISERVRRVVGLFSPIPGAMAFLNMRPDERSDGTRPYSLISSNCQTLVIELCTVLDVKFDPQTLANTLVAASMPKLVFGSILYNFSYRTIQYWATFSRHNLRSVRYLSHMAALIYLQIICIICLWETDQVMNRILRTGRFNSVQRTLHRTPPLLRKFYFTWGLYGYLPKLCFMHVWLCGDLIQAVNVFLEGKELKAILIVWTLLGIELTTAYQILKLASNLEVDNTHGLERGNMGSTEPYEGQHKLKEGLD